MTRRFSGRHMWMVMIGFFGLIFAVNFTMAWFASSTFGGTVVDNSYVAGQEFNGWLAAARAQEKLGWQTQLAVAADRHVTLLVASEGSAQGFTASGTAHHPLGREPDVPLVFTAAADGVLHSKRQLPAGRWLVRVGVHKGSDTKRLAETLQ